MCSDLSQAVSKDQGLMSALTVAHELAHTLHVGHDGSVECPDGTNIMATGSAIGSTSLQWSKCSANSMRASLESSDSSCFNDHPTSHKSNSSFQLYGTIYNADKQCQFAFGENYGRCAYYESHCDKLFCQKSGSSSCVSLSYPAAHGTYCGPHKWCIQGICVPDGSVPTAPVNGQWGEWGEYTKCNRLCGIGIQRRNRSCNNPVPANSGADCVGASIGYYKTCNTQSCPESTPSFRLVQCQTKDAGHKDFFDASRPCQLVCGSTTAAYYFGTVADGTKCQPGGKSTDICAQGKCQEVGCDLELNSGNGLDRCGVCKGNGSTCQLYTGSDYNEYATPGQYHLADVPAQSLDIIVKEVGGTFNFLGFKVENATSLAIRLPSYSSSYNLQGTTIYYDMQGWYYPDQLRATGVIPVPIKVFLVNIYNVKSEGVTWRYYGPVTERKRMASGKWLTGTWSGCSKSCAGGVQQRSVTCLRSDDNSTVSKELCASLVKPTQEQQCNILACPAQWHVTAWTTCTKSCGNGTRVRGLYCATLTSKGEHKIVADIECGTDRPVVSVFEYCNVITCPAQWSLTAWSQCSKTCGGGTITRTAVCKRIMADGSLVNVNYLECSYLHKPELTEVCNADIPCPKWKVKYSECSKTCGGGIQSPSIICTVAPMYDEVLNDSKCDINSKPDGSSLKNKECNTDLCDDPYHWVVSQSTCSVTCGQGLISVSVKCQKKSDNSVVANSNCKQVKPTPASTKECNAGVCVPEYTWKVKFSDCSKTCGGGVKSSIPYCNKLTDNTNVDNMLCDAATKPAVTSESCNEKACPMTYVWEVIHEACSVTCSTGVRIAKAVCKRETDRVSVTDSFCVKLKKPSLVNKTCDLGACPPTYSWIVKYGGCSVTCGSGLQTSYAACIRDEDKTEISESMCDATKRPIVTTKACQLEKCLTSYYWKATYGACVASCGPGYKVKMIECIERATGYFADSLKCTGMSLPKDQSCEVKACEPAYNATNMPLSYPVGCFRDVPKPRRVPIFIKSFRDEYNVDNTVPLIKKCAEKAHAMGYEFFSIQYHGECWAGAASTAESYYLNGVAHNCKNGVGASASNFVYKIGAPLVVKSLPSLKKLGCYKDDLSLTRPIPVYLDNFRNDVVWDPSNAADIIRMCAKSTQRRGWSVFGIQYYGECWSGESAGATYARGGSSSACWNGLGTNNEYFVYTFHIET